MFHSQTIRLFNAIATKQLGGFISQYVLYELKKTRDVDKIKREKMLNLSSSPFLTTLEATK
ncbi:MAG: hypothetical protein LBF82_03605 [Lactobacillales bacterium]|nr:hypothetical protein [Lactobacillales bacterium]